MEPGGLEKVSKDLYFCPECDGEGVNRRGYLCRVCEGTGVLRVRVDPDELY